MRLLPAISAFILTSTVSWAQGMIPAQNGSCPSGTNYAGSGYCRASGSDIYVPAQSGSCPSGANYAGSGYCRSSSARGYVPAHNGSCPSGSNYAGSGYCRVN
jgi:hypothetical protein